MPEFLGVCGNTQLIQGDGRRFPGLLVQGDSLSCLLDDLEEELPRGHATRTVRELVAAYELMMADAGRELPYFREPDGSQ